jgi:hypothetical protein
MAIHTSLMNGGARCDRAIGQMPRSIREIDLKFNRFRAPALAAGAVLMISGAGIVVAANPAAAVPAAAAPVAQLEPTTPDTDTLQEGDQTTPDLPAAGAAVDPAAVGLAAAKPAVAPGKAGLAAAPTPTVAETAAPETAAPETASETAGETPEGTGSEAASDGPGGHADPAGQNVDHQFEGVE